MSSKLTPERWASFHDKAKWDCQVALRGPDVINSSTIKVFTTGVIRAEMMPVMRVGGQITDHFRFVIVPRGDGRLEYRMWSHADAKLNVDLGHFIAHIVAAAEWLNIPIYSIDAPVWVEAMKESNWIRAIEILLPHLPKGSDAERVLGDYLVENQRRDRVIAAQDKLISERFRTRRLPKCNEEEL